MRRVMTLLGVMAIVVLAAGAAQAWYLPFDSEGVPGSGFDAAFYASTTMNSPWTNSDPSSTYDGAIWINSGSGPVMLTTAVNADLWVDDYDASWGSGGNGTGGANGWVEEVRLLNSDGSASGDFAADLPGTFNNTIPEQGVPGTYWQAYDNRGSKSKGYGSDTVFQFQLYLWTGTETTYAAALAAGEYTADASWSQTVMAAQYGAIPPMPPGDIDNPAMILENLPGDANGDGRVDINDLTIVLAHYGLSGSPLDVTYSEGDFTGDGKVDINDLTIVLANYGDTRIVPRRHGRRARAVDSGVGGRRSGLLAYVYWFPETRGVERKGG